MVFRQNYLKGICMNVLIKEIMRSVSLNEVIDSNVSTEDKCSSLERMQKGIEVKAKPDVYFECPQIRALTSEERRNIVTKTFQLGNKLFFDKTRNENATEFVHSYSLRFIELDTEAVEAIEHYEKRAVIG